ncbi:MAG: aconitate hydratase 1 [Gemmatimonadetes bacterium 13_1_40CM_4_69_8]|nr:MAG: aconitate hydratase 1 [Gemmatimonadetes bacterium 13_1_40CM_4_69_8]
MTTSNSFGTRARLVVAGRSFEIFRLEALDKRGLAIGRLPYSLRILLENLLRLEDGRTVRRDEIERLARWDPKKIPDDEIAFMPARVLMQDFTGVPAVVDFAAMRDAMQAMGGDPTLVNPLLPAELVIDHSVIVDEFGTPTAFQVNADLEFQRNRERYALLRWAQQTFQGFRVVPPDTGIVHQVNLEYLARVVFTTSGPTPQAYPDTLVGTDSHTTMINGLGVLGWGVGGIEAEAAMLGQAVSMLIPQVVGFRLTGKLAEGATATDLVLTVTELLRKRGVVGKFVEFYGPGIATLPLADRATIGNMAPEYGATVGLFPVDQETLRYLEFTGRTKEQVALVAAYMKEQGLFHTPDAPEPVYSDTLSLDLSTVEPSLAGPRRPQDRVSLRTVARAFLDALPTLVKPSSPIAAPGSPNGGRWEAEGGHVATAVEAPPQRRTHVDLKLDGVDCKLHHGSVVIAAITSCTNTSNPSVMIAAGLVAKKAVERGLESQPWVKTSLAPGSKVVTDYLDRAGLTPFLERLRFHLVGYGCTTCIGNSGPLPEPVSAAIAEGELVVCAVLSGNRNFEGRIQQEVRANYLASPPLVVAYALAGRIDLDLQQEPLGTGKDGKPVYLRDIWPSAKEVDDVIRTSIKSAMFRTQYGEVFKGDERWNGLPVPAGDRFAWEPDSTYIRRAPYFDAMPAAPAPIEDIRAVRVLCLLGDSITTDHISPAGSIRKTSPAGKYLVERGVEPKDFNSYGSRRGNHEIMVRGTFANVRLKNLLAPGTEGPVTVHLPDGEQLSIYDASVKYQTEGVPLLVLAGKEYGSGSSRDWAAKGPRLLGVRAVIAQSYERIHRSNLVGMGILPLQFLPDQSPATLGLTGKESFDLSGLADVLAEGFPRGKELTVRGTRPDGSRLEFRTTVRIDTPQELMYYRHGGILEYVLRQLRGSRA